MRFVWLLFAAPLFGQFLPNVQFSDLATTRDGTVLYVSSPLMLRGDNEFPYQKIFRIDAAGLHLVEQFQADQTPGFPYAANFYNAIEPDISGDGSVFSFVAQRTCNGGSACVFVELYESHITGAGPEIVYTGRTRLSRNGRYALRYDSTGIRMPNDPVPALIDLSTGERTGVPGLIPEGRQIASDGTVLTISYSDSAPLLVLWKAGNSQPLPASLGSAVRAVLSDNAAAVAAELTDASGRQVLVLDDVGSGTQVTLEGTDASLSDDGRLVCYLSAGQAYVSDRTTGSNLQLNTAPEGVREAVISGDGSTVWEATNWGRILRVDVASGSAQEVVPRTPLITSIQGAPVPGSLNWMYGAGLSGNTVNAPLPLPEFLAGQAVLLDSTPARISQLTPNLILYQIPFEMPPGSVSVSLALNDSPFDSPPQTLQLVAYAPQPVTSPMTFEAVIANRDFSALITDANPALPGEIVHVYFTGLGPVSPPLASGVAPLPGQLYPAAQGLSCVYFQSPGVTAPAAVLFAGIPANLIGVYQVDLQLPPAVSGISNNPSDTDVLFNCDDAIFFVAMNFSQ